MDLEERVKQLEEQVSLLLEAAKRATTTVSAHEFILLGPDGAARGRWFLNEHGPYLTMEDVAGSGVALGILDTSQKPSTLRLFGPGSHSRITLESHLAFSQIMTASPGYGSLQIFQNADSGEITFTRAGTVQARLRVDAVKALLEVTAPDGRSRYFVSPRPGEDGY